MSGDIHIVRLVLDRRELARVAVRHRLPRGVDDGYLLHAGLAQLFAKGSEPAKPPLLSFAIDDTNNRAQADPERVYLLAYSVLGKNALVAEMGVDHQRMVVACETRTVPELATGTRAGFRVRACPVVRTKQVGELPLRNNRRGRSISREVDAWLAGRLGAWQAEPPNQEFMLSERRGREWADRERVYTDWLGRELGREGGSVLEPGTKMATFRREPVHRGDPRSGARQRGMQRPNVVLEGVLRITDAAAFGRALTRGIGRHRAFGFGMLLLRPLPSDRAE